MFAVALLASIAAVVLGQSHLLSIRNPSHPDVLTSATFPKHFFNALPSGESISVVCGFVNGGETPLNISGIAGSINNPNDFTQYYQNFSGVAVGEVVEPGAELALDYAFKTYVPNDMQVQLSFTVYYEDGRSNLYTTTFYNETVTFVAPAAEGFSVRAMAPTALTLASFAGFFWALARFTPAIAVLKRMFTSSGKKGGKGNKAK